MIPTFSAKVRRMRAFSSCGIIVGGRATASSPDGACCNFPIGLGLRCAPFGHAAWATAG
jgi:hypothetical protein